mmetsp:Transcript_1411/g.2203  ORF Transcript_1411/g.2203 Transcript_1411/m.2203 type:complete len:103 (-) Transcript_1411:67-375(-)
MRREISISSQLPTTSYHDLGAPVSIPKILQEFHFPALHLGFSGLNPPWQAIHLVGTPSHTKTIYWLQYSQMYLLCKKTLFPVRPSGFCEASLAVETLLDHLP